MPTPETPIRDLPWAILDVETTGLQAALGHRVCEIAVLRIEPGQPPQRLSTLLNPKRSIEPEASAIHGLTLTDIATAPLFPDILNDLHNMLRGAVVIAHNAKFDVGFLVAEHRIAGAAVPDTPVLDTLALAPTLLQVDAGSLKRLAEHLALPTDRLHRADGDVDVTYHVLERLIQALEESAEEPVTLDALLARQGAPIRWTIPEPEELPEVLAMALQKGLPVEIRYRKALGEVTERIVEPMMASDRHLVAFCRLRGDQRTFRLDRILDARWPEPVSAAHPGRS